MAFSFHSSMQLHGVVFNYAQQNVKFTLTLDGIQHNRIGMQ
jgi:hypothetical protein